MEQLERLVSPGRLGEDPRGVWWSTWKLQRGAKLRVKEWFSPFLTLGPFNTLARVW